MHRVYQCDNCKKYLNDSRLITYIGERKDGKLTGRQFCLCRNCETAYYKKDIKNLVERIGYLPNFKHIGLNVNDAQAYLEQWNKSKKDE